MLQMTDHGKQFVTTDRFAELLAALMAKYADSGEDPIRVVEGGEFFIAATLISDEITDEKIQYTATDEDFSEFWTQNVEYIHRVLLDTMRKPAFQSRVYEDGILRLTTGGDVLLPPNWPL